MSSSRFGRLLGWLMGRAPEEQPQPVVSTTGAEPATLVRAAEIAMEGGRKRDALSLLGRALDAHLQRGEWRNAERICRIIIEMEPRVIRTRYTLAAIAVGRNQTARARARLKDYMTCVRAAHAEAMAAAPLMELAAATPDARMRKLIASALRDAGRFDLESAVLKGSGAPATGDSWPRAVSAALKRHDQNAPA